LSKQHSHELVIIGGLHRLDAANKKAVFYLMNNSLNRNRWESHKKRWMMFCLSFLEKSLGMGKDYKLGNFPDDGSIKSVHNMARAQSRHQDATTEICARTFLFNS
jgi:hypothetical protein